MWPHVMRQHAKMMATRARLLLPEWPVFAPTEQGAGLKLSGFGQSNGDTTFIEIAVMGRRERAADQGSLPDRRRRRDPATG